MPFLTAAAAIVLPFAFVAALLLAAYRTEQRALTPPEPESEADAPPVDVHADEDAR